MYSPKLISAIIKLLRYAICFRLASVRQFVTFMPRFHKLLVVTQHKRVAVRFQPNLKPHASPQAVSLGRWLARRLNLFLRNIGTRRACAKNNLTYCLFTAFNHLSWHRSSAAPNRQRKCDSNNLLSIVCSSQAQHWGTQRPMWIATT